MTAAALVHRYAPRGAARALFSRREREVLMSGPAGTGKSRACLEKLNALALANPRMRGLIVRKTAASLTSTGLVTWRENVVAEQLLNGSVDYYGGSTEEPAQYRYENGSRIMVGGMDKPTKIMSSEYDVIFVQEATELTVTDWESLTTRLRNGRVSFQQLMADCNPDAPWHWLKARADSGQTVMLESRHEDNPVLYGDDGTITPRGAEYMATLDALTGVRHLRLRRGLWVAAEGLIYDEWDPAVHVVDRFDIPAEWPRKWSIDFGYTNPFVCQFWAEDPDGRLFMYREIYMTRRTVDQHAATIAQAVMDRPTQSVGRSWKGAWTEPRPTRIVCDHDAEDRATLTRELGLPTVPALKTVGEGIQAVQRRLRPAGDGRARLFLLRGSLVERDAQLVEERKPTHTAEEIQSYVWDVQPGKPPKETPVKSNDHGADALRYLVMNTDISTRPGVRFLR